ncbi:MAG: hypothetical protein KatS3mg057_0408 [Herpetosiphonaceae bacterium]|nr:MAG: hypothetical protein KatS3mg057_0408 [Herpetosiphonaceae bacterium]
MALLKSLFWNRREHRLRAAWRLLLFTLILVVLLGVVAGGLLGATGGLAATLLFALAALLAAGSLRASSTAGPLPRWAFISTRPGGLILALAWLLVPC